MLPVLGKNTWAWSRNAGTSCLYDKRAQVLHQWKQWQQTFPSEGNEEQWQSPPQLERWVDQALVLERLRSVITAMRQAEGTFILFVDHFHRLAAYGLDEYSVDATLLLVPVLARHQIALIGARPLEQYRQYIERNAAFQRRFQEIVTPEAGREYWPEKEQISKG